MNPIHDYLRISGGTTASAMWQELSRLRRLGCRYDDMPATQEAFNAGLAALLASGMAEKTSNGVWVWVPAFQSQPAKRPRQENLFA